MKWGHRIAPAHSRLHFSVLLIFQFSVGSGEYFATHSKKLVVAALSRSFDQLDTTKTSRSEALVPFRTLVVLVEKPEVCGKPGLLCALSPSVDESLLSPSVHGWKLAMRSEMVRCFQIETGVCCFGRFLPGISCVTECLCLAATHQHPHSS